MKKRVLMYVPLLAIFLSGCSAFGHVESRRGASSSLVDFLYPNGEVPPKADSQLPRLELPLRVGIAFVPATHFDYIAENEKQKLLEDVAAAFRDRPYVASIDPIPDTYLRSARGVGGMQQVARMFRADIVALVSYDQLSLSGERDSAILYWTIIGALVVKGNTNEVQTMVDTAVFDVGTGQLLFRAPGLSSDQANSTLVDSGHELRELQVNGFELATADMVSNLDLELETFREAIHNGERAQAAWKAGSGGGGSVGLALLLLCAATSIARQAGSAPTDSRS